MSEGRDKEKMGSREKGEYQNRGEEGGIGKEGGGEEEKNIKIQFPSITVF